MPKEYKHCVESEVNSGKDMKIAQRMCAISFFKRHGMTPQQAEEKGMASYSDYEKEVFAAIEAIGPIFNAEAAKLSSETRNKLPDSAFLYVEPDGTKHLPYKNSAGKVDLKHLRNAIARLSQSGTGTVGGETWLTPALRKRLLAKARRILAQHGGNPSE